MSQSFSFYNSLLPIIRQNLPWEIKNYLSLRYKLTIMRVQDDINIIGKIKELMKLDSKLKDTNVVKNPYLERGVNTFQDPHSIDPLLSHHCWAMQNSKYLMIDCNTRTTLKQYRYMQRSILSQNGSEYLLK